MRVLVTGGSGFIGSHVVDKLRVAGHEPVIFDLRASPWHTADPPETILGSITDIDALTAAMEGIDAVTHLAAVADVNDVIKDPSTSEEINSRGTASVLEAMRRAGVQRIVYASTIWVYSDTASDTVDEDTLLPAPAHLYTSTKLAGELYCRSYQELYDVDYTVLRFGIPYGPRAREAAVIPAFVNKAFNGEPLTLSGDGMQSRRFVYVEDLAQGVVDGLAPAAVNRVYNLVSDENVTIRQIAELVQEFVGNTEIIFMPARPGDLGTKVVSGARAAAELGWTAATPFRDGVRRYIEWKRAQPAAPQSQAPAPAAAGSQALAPAMVSPPATIAAADDHGKKVLVISADIGEGHDLPARAIVREFLEETEGTQISIVNGLVAMGTFMTMVLRDNSAFMFRWLPWLFDFQYRLFMYFAPTRWLARRLLTAVSGRALLRMIRAQDPDLVISTYPGVTAVLGDLRQRGRIKVPVYSTITDLAGLHHWAHPGIDMHFVTHPESVAEVEAIAGAGSVRWSRPPTNLEFLSPRDRATARRALNLDADSTVIAVSGGGWGVGDLSGAVGAALACEDATVLCLCGHNEKLATRLAAEFGGEPRLTVMGFTDRMSDILAAADVLIHSSAGLTVLEAIIRGCPVISYGFGYGHVRASNLAYERFGLAQVATRAEDLGPALTRALAGPRPAPDARFAERASTATLIRNCERRVRALPAWRVRAVRASAAAAVALIVGVWGMTAGAAYSLISAVAPTHPLTDVTTAQPQVGLMLDARANQVPGLVRALTVTGMRASFALVPSGNLDSAADTVQAEGDDALPRLGDGGLVNWIETRRELHRFWHSVGLGTGADRHFLYASSGPSLGQWLLAHGNGGQLVAGSIRITGAKSWSRATRRLHAGEVIELRIGSSANAEQELTEVAAALRLHHLHAVTLAELLRDSGTPV